MSKLIDTKLGQFRYVTDGEKSWFLFQCPDCEELLPMPEEVLAGRAPVDHELRREGVGQAQFCSFKGTRDFGTQLISRMQAMRLMGYQPYHDEGQSEWATPIPGGVDGPI